MSAGKSAPLSPVGFGLILAGALVLVLAVFHRELLRPWRGPELRLSEIMAVDRSTLPDADGEFSGWIEIHNPTSHSQNLAGWSLTDDFRRPRRWQFPDWELGPGQFLVVFASGKNRTNSAGELHTNFRLKRAGEYLALIRPDGRTVVDEYLPKYPALDLDVSFGLRATGFADENGATERGLRRHAFFVAPTPGATNREEMFGRVADTKFSHGRGRYAEPFELTISTATPGAEIFYTTDGSAPRREHGTRYAGPIPIHQTTILRAAAFKPGFRPTDVDTQTFLFPGQVPAQSGTGLPATWGFRNDAPVTADYEIDPEITGDPRYRERLLPALAALPTLSLVLDPADLYDPVQGLYSNPLSTGLAWERPASVELIPADSGRGLHAPCGLRIQGGWSRRPEESPKHSFRLEFRERYGTASLKYPLFGRAGSRPLDSLILRAGCNNSWLHWSGVERRRGELLRDQFMRDSFHALGQLSADGRFFHLYLNGLYWGVYNACERPDASFQARHRGGTDNDYESRNAGQVLSGTEDVWNRIFELANAGLEEEERYDEFRRLVDLEDFAAFMLVQIYGGTSDWDAASNWYAGRRIYPSGKYRFFLWDSERSLEQVEANILAADDDRSPTRLFQALRKNPRFRELFRSLARRELGSGGALSPEATRARYARLAETLRPALVAESARWGDYRRDVHSYREGPYELYTVDDHWEAEVDRLLNHYFPARTQEVIRQLQAADLY